MAFRIEELTFGEDTPQEQVRTRNVFETLVKRAKANEILTEHEKEFFFQALMLSQLNDGKPEDYPQLDNSKFKWLFLIYMEDLTGGSKYYKPNGTKVALISISEAQSDLKYLIQKAEEWETVISKDVSDQLLLEAIYETRRELKNLIKQPVFASDMFYSGRFFFLYKKWGLLIRQKWIYHLAQEIFETQNNKPFLLLVENKTVEFNEYSLIHIISRHFSQLTTQYHTGKSYHKKEFMPRILGKQLQEIFHLISAKYNFKRIDKIVFSFKDRIHALWINERTRSIKGKGEEKYNRLETFYPLEEVDELNKITNNFTEIKIDDFISVFEEQ